MRRSTLVRVLGFGLLVLVVAPATTRVTAMSGAPAATTNQAFA